MYQTVVLLALIAFANAQEGCKVVTNRYSDCYGAYFVSTAVSDYYQPCENNADCYSLREPPEWCRLKAGQNWYGGGCHCDKVLKRCVIDRSSVRRPGYAPKLEFTHCYPDELFSCDD